MIRSVAEDQKVPFIIKNAYGLGLYGIAIAQTGFTVLLLYCYTDVFGLTPGQAGAILFFGSIIDIAVNLVIPWATARTKSKLGRYRPYVIYGSLLFSIAFSAMFIKPSLPSGMIFLYTFIVHLIYRFSYGMLLTPYSSLISRMSEDANERASIGSVKTSWSNLGVLTSAYLGLGLVSWLGEGDERVGFTYFAVIFGFVVFASILISGIAVKEREVNNATMAAEVGGLLPAMSLIRRNGQLVIALVAIIFYFIGYMVLNSSMIYFFKYVRLEPDFAKNAVLAAAVGGILMPAAWTPIVRATSKAAVWTVGGVMIAIAGILISSLSGLPLLAILSFYFLAGMGKSAIQINYFATIADAVDYGHWLHGRRAEAYSFGLLSIMSKIGYSLGGAMMGLALSWSGFEANQAQTPETVARLRMIAGYLPASMMIVSAVLILGFRINTQRHRAIVDDLRARLLSS